MVRLKSRTKFLKAVDKANFNPKSGLVKVSICAAAKSSQPYFNPKSGSVKVEKQLNFDVALKEFQSQKWFG